jgi:hypothetical protein
VLTRLRCGAAQESKYNVAITVGVVGLLLIWAYAFAKDAHRLLIHVRALRTLLLRFIALQRLMSGSVYAQPIGKMVSLINMLAENPLRCGAPRERSCMSSDALLAAV